MQFFFFADKVDLQILTIIKHKEYMVWRRQTFYRYRRVHVQRQISIYILHINVAYIARYMFDDIILKATV